MATTEVVFIRHGETRSNIERLLHGRTDEPLNALGLWQAERVAKRISTMVQTRLVYSSPLSRARVTAEAIAAQIGVETRFNENLAEFHFGDFEGSTIAGIQRSHPEIYRQMFDFTDLDFRFPNGESRREFHTRVLEAVEGILTAHIGERLVVVAHEGVIISAVTQLTGDDPNDWTKYSLGNCSITRMETNGAGLAEITCWNDVLHLTEDGEGI